MMNSYDNQFKVINSAFADIANRLQKIDKQISQARPRGSAGNFTPGSVLFGGSGGRIAQDNSNLFWDDTNNRLGIGNAAPRATLDVTGPILSTDYMRSEGYNTPPTGEGVEIGYVGAVGYISSFKRTDLTWKPLNLRGSTVSLLANNIQFLTGSDSTGIATILTDALTNTTGSALIAYHRTSGTPAVGFGSDFYTSLDSNTTADRAAMLRRTTWATATDASRKARTDYFIFDTANRLVVRMETSGTAGMIGFLGATAVVRQNITGVHSGTLAQLQTVMLNLLTGLANLGLITDSTT
jgi:hypothetical protein